VVVFTGVVVFGTISLVFYDYLYSDLRDRALVWRAAQECDRALVWFVVAVVVGFVSSVRFRLLLAASFVVYQT